jgi:hypothetical protein
VVKIATFTKPETVMGKLKYRHLEKSIYKKALIEFFQKNSSTLLSPEEVLKTATKLFTTSDFSGYNKDNTKELCNKENIIFAFPEGIILTEEKFYIFNIAIGATRMQSFSIDDFFQLEARHKTFTTYGRMTIRGQEVKKESTYKFNIDLYDELKIKLNRAKEDYNIEIQRIEAEKLRLENEDLEKKRTELIVNQKNVLSELDKDGNGEIDLIQNDFNKLLNKNQKQIIELDKNYVHQFVKISNFIKTKKANTQKIFESIRDTSSQEELEERFSLLKNQIHAYELLVFHSINMIGAIVSEDLISFYEIYESFDKLSIFNSNWENEVSEKLTNIGDKLDDLMYSIYNMEQNIVNELSHLSYVTQESFEDLNRSVTSQLREVESSINTNNLLSGIQTYQLYKINKNTKDLKS